MNNNVLIKIKECIENNYIEDALSLILSNEKEYKNNADFWNLKGVLCFHTGEVAVAISCFTSAVKLDPNHQDARKNLDDVRHHLLNNTSEDLSALNDENYVNRIVHILDNMASEIETCIKSISEFNLSECMHILKNVQNVMEIYSKEITRLKTIVDSRFMSNVFENVLICLENCLEDYYQNGGGNLTILVEFTLYPLLKELREEIYFFGLIYPNPDKMDNYYKNEFATVNVNQYAKQSLQTGKFKYPVSILVPAYNNLEYTKQCVESILKYTQEIDYELILVNDGSSDGTKEYFESVPYENKKVINLHKNTGAMLAYFIGVRAVEGRVLTSVSNDVIVTESWLENLLICLESDRKIGMVVPTTNSISNNQAISVTYDSIESMQEFAKKYNDSNPNKWFERERICPFLHVVPMSIYGKGLCLDRLFQYAEFSDDDISLQLRLKGYKLLLAKDTFCHHFGSVSLGEAQRESNSLQISREIFKQKNKIDAWHDLQNYASYLLTNAEFKKDQPLNVLCIDPGFGILPYQIKNGYKEKGNPNVTLYNFSTDKQFSNISYKLFGNFVSGETTSELLQIFQGQRFEYILFCKPIEEYNNVDLLLTSIKNILSDNGELRFIIRNPYSANTIYNLLSLNRNEFGNQVFKKFTSYEAIENLLSDAGFKDINILGITSDVNQSVADVVKKMASSFNIELNSSHNILYASDAFLYTVKGW